MVCGLKHDQKNTSVFDFHHRNSKEKSFNLNSNIIGNKSIKEVYKEADKCDLLCSNCHRLHH